MDFGAAINALKGGKRVCREGWNGRDMWLSMQRPDANSKMSLPYIYMKTVEGNFVPWLASQTDMLSEDWSIYSDPEVQDYTTDWGDKIITDPK